MKLDKIKNIRDKSMGYQYFGDDLIPGVNVKNINAGIINPLNRFGSLLGTAYNQYGEGLRGALGQNQDDYAQQFLDGKLAGQKGLKDIVQITLKDGKEQSFDVSTKEGADAMNKAIDAQQPMKPASDNPQPVPIYNAQERVKKYGVKKAEDMGMMEWAKANKELAAKVKPGQSGYDAIQFALGKTEVKPEDIRGYMDDTGRSAEDVRGILGKGTQVETVISKGKPDVTTIGPIPTVGGPEVEIPAGNFSEMSQSIQDLFAPRQETGATPFNFGFQNVMDQSFSQPFLMNFIKKVPGTK